MAWVGGSERDAGKLSYGSVAGLWDRETRPEPEATHNDVLRIFLVFVGRCWASQSALQREYPSNAQSPPNGPEATRT